MMMKIVLRKLLSRHREISVTAVTFCNHSNGSIPIYIIYEIKTTWIIHLIKYTKDSVET